MKLHFCEVPTVDIGMGGATGGCGGQCPPHFWDQGGTGGAEGRSNENDICFYSRQFLFSTVQVTYISAFRLKTER